MKRTSIYITLFLILLSAPAWAKLELVNKITGIEDPLLKNAIERLKINEHISKGTLTVKDVYKFFEQGPEQIKKAVEPYGYFKPKIDSDLTRRHQTFTANYQVTRGEALRITDLTIRLAGPGKHDKRIINALHKLPIKQGDIFNAEKFKKAENALIIAAQQSGYLTANFDKDLIRININEYTCTIILNLNTKKRFYFGSLRFSPTPLDNRFLYRYVHFCAGEPFSYAKLLELQQLLSGSGYFKSVSVVPERKRNVNQRVPIKVNLIMAKKKQYLMGLGYGTASGVRATLGYNAKWVNRWGHKIRANMVLAHIEDNIALQYIIPGKNPSHDNYLFTANVQRQEPKRSKSKMVTIGFAHLRTYKLWSRTLSLNYEWERYRVDKGDPYENSRLLLPTLTFSRTTTDNVINPTKGSRFNISLRGATQTLASTVDFAQVDIQYKWLHTFFENHRFVLRGDLGYTVVHDLYKLPVSKRFYTGGIDSIRGFRFKDIGPGRYLMIASAEYQYRVKGNWFAAIFYDTGNATDHWNDPLKQGVGLGVVWQSPLGAARAYLATTLSDGNRPLRFEISIGPEL